MRLVISFNLTYHTWFKYLRFSSYERFRDYCPNHPWGTPSCPAFSPIHWPLYPHVLQSLAKGQPKSRVIFWLSPAVYDILPLPLSGAILVLWASAAEMLNFFPSPSFVHTWLKMALVVMSQQLDCSSVPSSSSSCGHMTFPIWLPPSQASGGRKLTFGIRSVYSGSFAMTPKWS